MTNAFLIRTAIVVVILAAVCAIAWVYTPHRHFVGVSAVCYGFLIGWFAAWYSVYRYSPRHPV